MATYSELLDDIEEYLKNEIIYVKRYSNDGLIIPVRRLDNTKEVVYANQKDINNPKKYIVCRLNTMPDDIIE